MPLVDFLTFSAGYVPAADVAAQRRCYDYLKETIALLKGRVGSPAEQENDKSQLSLLKDLAAVTDVASGSRRYKRSVTFWKYWDKNKDRVIRIHENTTDNEDVLTQIGLLEDGRYYNE